MFDILWKQAFHRYHGPTQVPVEFRNSLFERGTGVFLQESACYGFFFLVRMPLKNVVHTRNGGKTGSLCTEAQ